MTVLRCTNLVLQSACDDNSVDDGAGKRHCGRAQDKTDRTQGRRTGEAVPSAKSADERNKKSGGGRGTTAHWHSLALVARAQQEGANTVRRQQEFGRKV